MDGGIQRVVIPYTPREPFKPYHNRTQRWSAIVAHRRAGKTVACINELLRGALTCKLEAPRFAYIAPHYNQAKDVAWEYLKRFASPVLQFGGGVNESELRVDLPNGGRVRLYGADNFDRLRGLYFDGVVLDEFADMDPRIWEVLRPTLSDREGWCTWIGTPKGHNEFYKIVEKAKADPDYFFLALKASDTKLVNPAELEKARKDMTPDQYAQEYECSFEAAVQGAYYAEQFKAIDAEKRLTKVPYEHGVEVHTAWDLGVGDSTAIWFYQLVGFEVRVIDYYEASGVGLDHYVREVRSKPYLYGKHWFPHDVKVRELGSGKSREETLEGLGVRVNVAPRVSIDDGINAVRRVLPRCWFDAEKCGRGVEGLRLYRREFDEKRKVFRVSPLHDWTSHPADAFRYMSLTVDQSKPQGAMPEIDFSWVQ